jgi:hypothetical protein
MIETLSCEIEFMDLIPSKEATASSIFLVTEVSTSAGAAPG